jgi:hypothetical protein
MKYKIPNWLKLTGILFLVVALSYVNACMISLGLDWGYDLIAAIAGQNQELNQGIMCMNALSFAAFPLGIGVYIAYTETFLARPQTKLWLGITLGLCTLPVLFHLWLESGSIKAQEIVIETLCALTVGALSFLCTRPLIKRVSAFTNPMFAFKASLIYLIPIALAYLLTTSGLLEGERGYLEELLAYAILLFATCAIVLKKTKPTNKTQLMFVSLLATIPIAYANLLNVLGNLLSLSLDTIHMGANLSGQALFSSLLISIVYVLALSLACLAFEEYIHRI